MNLGLKALACLLLYPDAALKDNLQEIKEAVAESTLANDQKEALEIFINHMIETPMAVYRRICGDFVSARRQVLTFLSTCTGIRGNEARR